MIVTEAERETFLTDGVVKLTDAVSLDVVAEINEFADEQMRSPGRWVTDTNPGATTNRLFTTRYLWETHPAVHRFVFESGVDRIAAAMLDTPDVRFYFDHLLVKEPDTAGPTPWHQDIPYWPFLGEQICSVWVACTPTKVEESSLEFVRGSHRWGAYYAPESFDAEKKWTADADGDKCPDIDADRASYDIVGFDVEPGDAIVFSAWIVHGAPGNAGDHRRVAMSTRWLGDDATWHPHPGCDPTVTQADTTAIPGATPADNDRFPLFTPTSS